MSGPLLWLQNCLNKTADDRENDGECICQQKKNKHFPDIVFFSAVGDFRKIWMHAAQCV